VRDAANETRRFEVFFSFILGLNGIFKATVELFLLLMQKHSLLHRKSWAKILK